MINGEFSTGKRDSEECFGLGWWAVTLVVASSFVIMRDLCVDVGFAEKRGFVIGWGSDQLSSSIISPFPLKIFKFLGFVSDQDSENLLTNHTDDPTKAISFSSFVLPVSSSTSNFHSRSYMLLFRGWLLHFMAFVFPSVLDEISNVLLLRRRFSISPRVRREEKIIFTLTFEDGRRGKAFKRNLDEEIMARSRPFRLFSLTKSVFFSGLISIADRVGFAFALGARKKSWNQTFWEKLETCCKTS